LPRQAPLSKFSKASLLSLKGAKVRREVLSALTKDQRRQLLYDWGFRGRPDQQMPPGDWFIWLIMTGRGWGKTRTATENTARLIKGLRPDS